MSRFLLVDTNYLAYRAYHTTGNLSFKNVRTGVLYGVLRELCWMVGWYKPEGIAWCFDSKTSKRKRLRPEYKAGRETDDNREDRLKVYKEIKALRREHLPALGFRNVFVQKGYEADDIIASLAARLHFADTAVIIGADKDLHQCLNPHVTMFNPMTRKEYTADDFWNQWGIHPGQWARCKSIAGCRSDNIEGIEGVGEKTAAKWLRGDLPDTAAAHKKIMKGLKRIDKNDRIVRLPMKGTKRFEWSRDRLTKKRWKRLVRRLGMNSLLIESPFM
jgi:DNA polymerase-1